uniref:Putative secreted protein n=1 Tax=Ixodes ricinus TaxID=34613 RepID=A0A6B0U337_IXORI
MHSLAVGLLSVVQWFLSPVFNFAGWEKLAEVLNTSVLVLYLWQVGKFQGFELRQLGQRLDPAVAHVATADHP